MTKNRKMLALAIALVIMLVTVSSALIAVLVAGNQNAQSKVHVKYTSSDVNVKVEAKYYVGTTGTDMIDKSNSNKTYVELNAIKSSGSLDQPVDEVNLSKENSKIIYEYKFTNVSDKIPATISQLVEDGSVVIPKDSNNNVTLTYTSSSTSLGAGASSDATTLNTQGLPAGTTRYVYVIVSIVELLYDVDFEGTFGWDLAKGDAITSNTTGGSQSIVVDTTDEKLYNKSAMENIQLVVGVENTEPVYPMIEDKCFTGWYFDSGYNNRVEFPIIPTADTKLYPKHETATSDLMYYYDSDALGYYVGDGDAYSGSETDIIIPDAYDDSNGQQKVIGVNDSAFYHLENITSITMPNTITSIGLSAFEMCTGLTSIVIPENVTYISSSAFMGCTELTDITIPRNVEYVGEYSFETCTGLTSLIFENGVTSIEALAFSSCTNLDSIYIPASIISISESAFYYCSGLKSITVDKDNTIYRGEGNCIIEKSSNTLVIGCKNSVISNSVTNIGSSAFASCNGLTSIIIPNSVTIISSSAFDNCGGLTSITIPSSVTAIGNYAFNNCSSITNVTIGSGVKKIGNRAFSGCSKLTSVTFANPNGWTVTTSSTATTGTAVTISTTDLAANATLLKTTHVSKYWNRA